MNYPDKQNTISLLGEWKTHHAAVEKLMDGTKASIGLDPNGPMFDTAWKLFDAYTGAMVVEVGDFGGWMEWHHMENEMGARGMEAGYDGKLKPVKTLAHLYGLIVESRKRMESGC